MRLEPLFLVLADDDRDATETFAELLRLMITPEPRILLAFDGKEAMDTVLACDPLPDAVVMDIEMPRMDGLNSAIGIRSGLGANTPVLIAISGHVDMTRLASVSSAFDHTMTKPANLDDLVELLSTL